MYKGCAKDAEADVDAWAASKMDVYARVQGMFVKTGVLHIPLRTDVLKKTGMFIKARASPLVIQPRTGQHRHESRAFARMHTAY